MLTVRAIYDGQTLQLPKNLVVKKPQEVLVTFLENIEKGEERALEERFEALFQQWFSETGLSSNPAVILGNPAYQKIIGLGKPAIPLILNKLKKDPYHLFYALFKITGVNPVPKKHSGYPSEMAKFWLEWGVKKKYIEK